MATAKIITILALVSLFAGCASDNIAAHRFAYKDQYFADKEACDANGGHIVMPGTHLQRPGETPSFGTVYYCAR